MQKGVHYSSSPGATRLLPWSRSTLCLMALAGSCHLHLVFWAGLLEQFVLVLPSCMVACSTPGKEVWASCRRGHGACLLPPFSVPPPWSCSEDLSALHSESLGRHHVDTRGLGDWVFVLSNGLHILCLPSPRLRFLAFGRGHTPAWQESEVTESVCADIVAKKNNANFFPCICGALCTLWATIGFFSHPDSLCLSGPTVCQVEDS